MMTQRSNEVRFEAVVFDLDGTLLDSLVDIANAVNEVLQAIGHPQYPVADFRYLVGDGVSLLFQRAVPDCVTDETLRAECMRRYESAYAARWDQTSVPYPGIPELLDELATREMRMAVLSNKPDPFTQKCVSHFFPSEPFECVLGHSDRFPRKPDPASALWIGESMGLRPESIAYVGDTNTDMRTAVGAGFFPIGVSWGFRSEAELWESGAAKVVTSTKELAAVLLRQSW
jgi:phosphoglycolate phosphatase